jgi:hypothetical protein
LLAALRFSDTFEMLRNRAMCWFAGLTTGLIATAGVWPGTAVAQWTTTNLHPLGAQSSAVAAIAQGAQAGDVRFPLSPFFPALWSGTPTSVVNLTPPPGGFTGTVNGSWGDEQVGEYGPGGAALWHGSAGSFISLHPAGAVASAAYATRQGEQVGFADVGGPNGQHAALWHGSAASWIDLHPAGARLSRAHATSGQQQGGVAQFLVNSIWQPHAVLWSGSAASSIDLNPAPAVVSAVYGMAPGQQVGWTKALFEGEHAAIWSGTASSWIDIHPFPGFGSSVLNSTIVWAQAGYSNVPGSSLQHAGVWFGTASSFIDLQQFLPAGYTSSTATCIDWYDNKLWVGGYAVNSLGYAEAFRVDFDDSLTRIRGAAWRGGGCSAQAAVGVSAAEFWSGTDDRCLHQAFGRQLTRCN